MTWRPKQTTHLQSNFTEDQYFEVENKLPNSTEHINLLTSYITKYLLPEISVLKSFLDVGAGPGHIFEKLCSNFNKSTLVDPNEGFGALYQRIEDHNEGSNFIIGNFQEINFFSKYSFILCSHVFYHINKSYWLDSLNKIRSLLYPEGMALVTLVSPLGGFHDLCNSINANYSNSSGLIEILQKNGFLFRVSKVRCDYKFDCFEELLKLLMLFVIDDCFLPEEYDEISYQGKLDIESKILHFANSCKNKDKYEFSTIEDYITIFK